MNIQEDFLYDEKFWIMLLIVLLVIFLLGIQFAIIVVIIWLIFLWWNKYKIKIPPSDK
jgi:hypothetical protein